MPYTCRIWSASLLLIGHGSSDIRAREAFDYVVDLLNLILEASDFVSLGSMSLTSWKGSEIPWPLYQMSSGSSIFFAQRIRIKYDIMREVNMSIRGQNPE